MVVTNRHTDRPTDTTRPITKGHLLKLRYGLIIMTTVIIVISVLMATDSAERDVLAVARWAAVVKFGQTL